ncbi:MAG: TIM barrel protein [Cypionkella sp.]|nr:TIM barrel protein [Cypionkella sp.]
MLTAARDTLGAALARAADMGVTFVLENIEDIEPSDRAALCEALDWQALELSVDTGHAHYAHVSTGAPPVDFYIRAAGDARLGHIHLQDADGFADRHWQIGHGTILWQSVFRGHCPDRRQPAPDPELRDKAGVMPSAAYLQGHGDRRMRLLKFVVLSDLHLACPVQPVNGPGHRPHGWPAARRGDQPRPCRCDLRAPCGRPGRPGEWRPIIALPRGGTAQCCRPPPAVPCPHHAGQPRPARAFSVWPFGLMRGRPAGRVSPVIDAWGNYRVILLDTCEPGACRRRWLWGRSAGLDWLAARLDEAQDPCR